MLHIAFLISSIVFGQEKIIETAELGDIIEPEVIRFSFNTPGWYVLAFLFGLILIFLFVKWVIKYRKNRYRREAIKQIIELQQSSQEESILNQVLVILRLTAISAFGRKQVAQLSGKEWINFLDSKVKNKLFANYDSFIQGFVYKGVVPEKNKVDEIIQLSIKWIKTHA